MSNERFSDAEIVAILKQAEDGVPVSDLCSEYGISTSSFYKWRAKFGWMGASFTSDIQATDHTKDREIDDVSDQGATDGPADKPPRKRRWWWWLLGFIVLLAFCDDDDRRQYCYTFGSEQRCFDRPLPKDAFCYLIDGEVRCYKQPLQ
jgi:putative transposase